MQTGKLPRFYVVFARERFRLHDVPRLFLSGALAILLALLSLGTAAAQSRVPSPQLKGDEPVDWWFVFKFNAGSFPSCGGVERACPFGGSAQPYKQGFGQQFAYASSADPTLQKGGGCLGDSTADPVGATFDEIYNGHFSYVIWNDQFYDDPLPTKGAPAGHSKGMLAWNDDGDGFVMQTSTPSWPASGNASIPRRTDGNTLGCIKDNDVLVSQHVFALKLTRSDVITVLKALANASIVTDPANPQIVSASGPPDLQALVRSLGKKSPSKTATMDRLSSGVTLISKPSALNVAPWQMVSALLGGEPLRAATWWAKPKIPTTITGDAPACWDASLGAPGAVEIATTGSWSGTTIGFQGTATPSGNHAKIGVATGKHPYVIFGDLNQQGALSGNCKSSQNGRGGLFYVIENSQLFNSVRDLIHGDTAPAQ